jgi:hypothetical protein
MDSCTSGIGQTLPSTRYTAVWTEVLAYQTQQKREILVPRVAIRASPS